MGVFGVRLNHQSKSVLARQEIIAEPAPNKKASPVLEML